MTRTGNTVAVIGLAVMGAPMAANLIGAGYDVVGFNRSPGKVETHVASGSTPICRSSAHFPREMEERND
jgi:2-hydroxy-3-oxopropionate reductase